MNQACERCGGVGRYTITAISGNEVDVPCIACLRAKAATFDVLSERVKAGEWRVDQREIVPFIYAPKITVAATGKHFSGPTLADAVKAAMEAEGR